MLVYTPKTMHHIQGSLEKSIMSVMHHHENKAKTTVCGGVKEHRKKTAGGGRTAN
jgi:hypothetical protein